MKKSILNRRTITYLIILCSGLLVLWPGFPDVSAQEGSIFDSPLPTPTPSLSPEAKLALQYLSDKYGVPVKDMVIANEIEQAYPLLNRTFKALVILDTRGFESPSYQLLVDVQTKEIIEEVSAIQQAALAAQAKKYGKLHPTLYERLAQVSEDTELPVAIWVTPTGDEKTEADTFAILAAEFPEAAAALADGSVPEDVADEAVREKVEKWLAELQTEEVARRLQPVAALLAGQGFKPEPLTGMPAISARLPKGVILRLNQQPEVGLIYLTEEEGAAEMNVAVPTNRVSAVWGRGNTGQNERLAILEDSNINDATNQCLNIVSSRPGVLGPTTGPEHKTRVANVAACNDTGAFKGVAYTARIYDAGFDASNGFINSMIDAVEALQWSVGSPNYADIVNLSYRWETDGYVNWTDRAFDYWARKRRATIVKSAGNNGSYITSPGKGWNVITVGGSNDQGTVDWSDDAMYYVSLPNSSNYINPLPPPGGAPWDREKPEVVAPAQNIRTYDRSGNANDVSGTSYAAPQVAGLAALLMNQDGSLRSWPTAVKAIIMASATHNIDGPRHIPGGQDLKDGAGSINANLADLIAQNDQGTGSSTAACSTPCFWRIITNDSVLPEYGNLERRFYAAQGERIRVAISWFSRPDPAGLDYAVDVLALDYNLLVFAPNNALVGYNASFSNNYELVEFTAPSSGLYRIRVNRADTPFTETGEFTNNYLGIAWTSATALNQSFWRGGVQWSRSVPVANGVVQWGSASEWWTGPFTLGGLAGSGSMQSESNFIVGNILWQAYWRGNEGWSRTVPIVNNNIDWSSASGWAGPIPIAALPGSGSMQSQGNFVMGNTLWQAFWRGNEGWSRTVPIVNGVVQWGSASGWSGPIPIAALPGNGSFQAQDNYLFP